MTSFYHKTYQCQMIKLPLAHEDGGLYCESILNGRKCMKQNKTNLRTVAAAVVDTVHAPPAITFLHERHSQIPTAVRLTES